jgi:hypothetical protein
MPEERKQYYQGAVALLVLGALARFPMMIVLRRGPALVYWDFSYLQAAQAILRGDFHALGLRVPVYPLLIVLCGLSPLALWFAQSILGLAASWMIFDMAFRRTRHSLWSLLIALVCSLTPEVLEYESSMMSEALTGFLLVASLWLITRDEHAGENNIRYPLGLGLTIALAGLTRPLMIALVPVYYCFLVPLGPPARLLQRVTLRRTLLFSLPVIVFISAWCSFNYVNSGYFTPTTFTGGNLMDQVNPYVHLAPERFALVRDAWLKSRRVITNPDNRNACLVFEDAAAEIERKTGKTKAQVTHDYALLARYLQIHHPLLCLRRAEQGWMQFWGEPTRDETEWPQESNVALGEFGMTLINFLVREIEAAFLVLALLSLPCAMVYRKAFVKHEYLIFASVLWVSVFAAFTEYGENRRFCVPFYALIVYTLMTRAWQWITAASMEKTPLSSN